MASPISHGSKAQTGPNRLDGAIPLFLLGSPRSGTTLLARILNAHPAVLMTNESAVFLQLNDNIVKSRRGVRAGLLYGKTYNDLWAEHLAENARRLIESYYEKICQAEGKERLRYWGEKHPHHSDCLPFLEALYPDAKYLYIVRDPRDTACSIAEMTQVEFTRALGNWRKFTDKYEGFFQSLGADRRFCLRYEDLVANYSGLTEKILDWLGLDIAEAVSLFLANFRDVDAHAIRAVRLQRQDFQKTSVGRWKRELSEGDRQLAVEVAGDFMDRYGYPR